MSETQAADINELLPYERPEDFRAAVSRVLESPSLRQGLQFYFAEHERGELMRTLAESDDMNHLQETFSARIVQAVAAAATQGVTLDFERSLSNQQKVLYISNHRDIICDPGLLSYMLTRQGLRTPKICLGDNLLVHPIFADWVRLNKGIIVKRGLSQRELFRWSKALSAAIQGEVLGGRDSVWIAQLEGRAKDGNDLTHPGVIKMLTLAAPADQALDHLSALRLTPVAISYEFDPCDHFKARELTLTRIQAGQYQKGPKEDLISMWEGVRGAKGRVHIQISAPLDENTLAMKEARALPNRRDQVQRIVRWVDQEIHRGYRLWPSNWIALDLLAESSSGLGSHYTVEDRERFIDRMQTRLGSLHEDPRLADSWNLLRQFFLEMYANPIKNKAGLGIAPKPAELGQSSINQSL